jgi:AcrR family transcriptional regulator
VSSVDARHRILAAARRLLETTPFADLTVDAVMSEAGLTRTVFYRHYPALPHMAADLLPDSDAPLAGQIEATPGGRDQIVEAMVAALVGVYAQHGPLLRAIDDAARHDPEVAAHLDAALVAPRKLIADLLSQARRPPPDVRETAALLMAAHRAYLLDTFGSGRPARGARARATAALEALWTRLLG